MYVVVLKYKNSWFSDTVPRDMLEATNQFSVLAFQISTKL